jgi:hypothetical protein
MNNLANLQFGGTEAVLTQQNVSWEPRVQGQLRKGIAHFDDIGQPASWWLADIDQDRARGGSRDWRPCRHRRIGYCGWIVGGCRRQRDASWANPDQFWIDLSQLHMSQDHAEHEYPGEQGCQKSDDGMLFHLASVFLRVLYLETYCFLT